MDLDLNQHFLKLPRQVFITIRGPNAWQRIGKINDLLRRVSDDYFIVRENDLQKKEGSEYHFHALVSLKKDLKPNWYRKGIHINVQKVGDPARTPIIPEDEVMADHLKYGADADDLDVIDKLMIDFHIKQNVKERALICKLNKQTHLQRIITYMLKDTPVEEYLTYICSTSKPCARQI